MDGTIVFIFLLDHLPENILNKTLETVEVTHTNYSSPHTCDYAITDPLLQLISRELEVLMIPKWLVDERNQKSLTNSTKEINETSYESHLDTNKVVKSSLEVTQEHSNSNKLVNYEHFLVKSSLNEKDKDSMIAVKAPFLAAIFESLSNVTAQTCGGTVIAPHWVLTAASCINLMSNMNAETTNVTEQSIYTVIVNASDPLIDGSAHNVTEIQVHPSDVTDQKNQIAKVALIKIEPAVGIEVVPLFGNVEDGMHVTVYGWSVKKTDSNYDAMVLTAFKAIILSPEDCSTHYNITEDTSEICLATSDEHAENINQLSWGGPVLTQAGDMLAVARGDGLAPLAAWPLAAHLTWIHDTTINGTYK